ncbi:unnamed protein product [Auanema sp. JU1783]|nr:unnamed protein product [Auanema sp. JU1783]
MCIRDRIHAYATFKEAARALNLLQTDDEWERCLQEASVYQMPAALRSLFATILLFCEPTEPFQLWLNHRDAMSEDYLHRYQTALNDPEYTATEDIYNCALLDIEDVLFKNGQSLVNHDGFVLPTTDHRNTGTHYNIKYI